MQFVRSNYFNNPCNLFSLTKLSAECCHSFVQFMPQGHAEQDSSRNILKVNISLRNQQPFSPCCCDPQWGKPVMQTSIELFYEVDEGQFSHWKVVYLEGRGGLPAACHFYQMWPGVCQLRKHRAICGCWKRSLLARSLGWETAFCSQTCLTYFQSADKLRLHEALLYICPL